MASSDLGRDPPQSDEPESPDAVPHDPPVRLSEVAAVQRHVDFVFQRLRSLGGGNREK